MPNQFAYIALCTWPLITILLCYRYKPLTAVFAGLVAGSLLLPVNVEIGIQYLPRIDKHTIPSVSLFITLFVVSKARIQLIPRGKMERYIFLLILLVPLLTLYGNSQPLYSDYSSSQGYNLYDSITEVVETYLVFIPFLLGLSLVKTFGDHKNVFIFTVCAALLYLLPILLEVRLSPQLHSWLYGFFPHSFGQQVRFGGYRPVVFMGHGLAVAFFIATAFCSAVILAKIGAKILGKPAVLYCVVLFVLLLLCKSLGPLMLSMVFAVLVYSSTTRVLRLTVISSACVVMAYPFIVLGDVGIGNLLVKLFNQIDTGRADSFAFRLNSEKVLLAHAKEKILFGWGAWGRNRVNGVITDSFWIITLGKWGLTGIFSTFGIIVLAIFKATSRKIGSDRSPEVMLCLGHACLLLIITADQFVNASISSSGLYLFLVGALIGRLKYMSRKRVASKYRDRYYGHSGKIRNHA